ncbi:MAG: HNH endonuclease, partial [Gammaproteobacteria bacterium]|nr:HNH endonuclease [Gammaproteobacteria bacterium]
IIATRGESHASLKARKDYLPPLSNEALFARDARLCLYCGGRFRDRELSRDHVTPLSMGGTDSWNNVVTACKRCNNHKAGRTPEQAGMKLLAVPFVPTHAEYVFLRGRQVLTDQMQFLLAHFPRTSPLHHRLQHG